MNGNLAPSIPNKHYSEINSEVPSSHFTSPHRRNINPNKNYAEVFLQSSAQPELLKPDDQSESKTLADFSLFSDTASRKSTKSFTNVQDFISKFDLTDINQILNAMNDKKALIAAFQQYRPRTDFISLTEIKKSKHAKIKIYKDALFLGEMQNEKKHGKGILVYTDGRFYEGEWENDSKHGRGYEITSTGGKYHGSFANGKPHGHGTYVWVSGETYDGQWREGYKHGEGTWKGVDGESYVGEWQFGKQEGKGTFIWKNGDKYEGTFKAFLKHGFGSEKFSNGDYYSGNYNNGKPHGYGEYYWVTKGYYKGFFQNGLRQGKGIWRSGDTPPDTYDGEWINDKKSGTGIFTWGTGNKYEGEFFEDCRQGYGVMTWTDGSYYKGYWDKGIQNGEGELHISGKPAKIGLFKNNIFMGPLDNPDTSDHFKDVDKLPEFKPGRTSLSPLKNSVNYTKNRDITASSSKKGKLQLNKIMMDGYGGPGPGSVDKHERFVKAQLSLNETDRFDNDSSFESSSRIQTEGSVENLERGKRSFYSLTPKKIKPIKEADLSVISDTVSIKENRRKLKLPKIAKDPSEAKVSPRLYDEERYPKRPDGCLLSNSEWIRWMNYRKRLPPQYLKKLRDLTQPMVCDHIREMINEPVWKPNGGGKVERGKTELIQMQPLGVLRGPVRNY